MAENIFAEIYNKILGLFGQSTPKEDSKDVAVNRLRLVLMQDRTNLTPEIMQRMRKELIELLSKYVELDKEALELNFEQEGEQMALMLSIPVVRAKDEAEIEAALKETEENSQEAEENSEETEEEENSEEEENQKDLDGENNDNSESRPEEFENTEEPVENIEESTQASEKSEKTQEPKKNKNKKNSEEE